jgi:hypothetical protein
VTSIGSAPSFGVNASVERGRLRRRILADQRPSRRPGPLRL